tara:strand:- start:40 stop:759 length:720 start_codon:yes stop_codon:yes gene_type:complete
MNKIAALTGRQYNLVDYYGHPEADRVVVIMGSASETCEQVADKLNADGEKVGVVKVRLFRPWPTERLIEAIPQTVKKISVLDRTREDGALGAPMYLDVSATFAEKAQSGSGVAKGLVNPDLIVGGTYGLASKEFTPATAKAVFDDLKSDAPKNKFVVGINDDVTHTSLPVGPEFEVQPEGTTQCIFWGLGTDGTVGANKQAIKTIGNNSDMHTQGTVLTRSSFLPFHYVPTRTSCTRCL